MFDLEQKVSRLVQKIAKRDEKIEDLEDKNKIVLEAKEQALLSSISETKAAMQEKIRKLQLRDQHELQQKERLLVEKNRDLDLVVQAEKQKAIDLELALEKASNQLAQSKWSKARTPKLQSDRRDYMRSIR